MIGIKISDNLQGTLKAAYDEAGVKAILMKRCVYLDWHDKKLQRRIVALEKLIRHKRTDRRAAAYRAMLRGKLVELWQIRENQRPTWDGVRRIKTEGER